MISSFSNVLARRDLLRELVRSELLASSAGSRLGWLWWLLDPLLMMLIYWGVVEGLLGRGRAHYAPYPIFVLCGLMAWKHCSSAVGKSSRILRRQERLIKAVAFPTIVLPVSIVLTAFAYFLFGFLVLLVGSIVFSNQQHTGDLAPLVQVPALMLLQVIVVTGLCLAVAAFGALVSDLGNLMTHILRVGFYLSPGLYGLDLVREATSTRIGGTWGTVVFAIYMMNPFAIIITGYRHAVFYGTWLEPQYWALLAGEAALFGFLGYWIYQHYDRRVIKFL